jgi:hypothetical protein
MQEKYSFDSVTMKKIGTGALIAGAGAILTYISQNIAQVNYGIYTPMVVSLLSIAVNALREYIKGE